MTTQIYPPTFIDLLNQTSKSLNVVVSIDGLNYYLAAADVFTKIRYGDPGIHYGDPGLVYGGLRLVGNFKPYLNLDGSMSIGQIIEPEQGRGSIQLLTLNFTDKDGFMSQLMAPGVLVDEPLGNKFVTVYIGMQNSSFPEDYLIIMRGFISGMTYMPAQVSLQLADPNVKRINPICQVQTSVLTLAITTTDYVIPIAPVAGSFYKEIQGPDLTFDPSTICYIKIDDEFMIYGPPKLVTGPITVTAGSSTSSFFVSLTDVVKFSVHDSILVEHADTSNPTSQSVISAINTGTGQITVDQPFSYGPTAGMLVIAGSNQNLSLTIVSGIDQQNFTLSVGDASRLQVGEYVLVQNFDGSGATAATTISAVNHGTGQVTVTDLLGFVPMTGQVCIFFSIIVQQRGARTATSPLSIPAAHDLGAGVDNIIQIQDNAINIALKMALSGFNGPYKTGQAVSSIVDTTDPTLGLVAGSILLPPGVDADLNLGLAIGDWVTIVGSTHGNNGTFQITDIRDALSYNNNLLITTGALNVERPAPGVTLNLRSQFDTYPTLCGSSMAGYEVDVSNMITLKDNFFSQPENTLRFLIFQSFSLKTFTEGELFLPLGMYSITRYGRVSAKVSTPPIADQTLQILDNTNIVDAQNLSLTRSINNRRYFSEIDYSYDLADDDSTYQNNKIFLNATALSKISISTPLPITSKGLRTDLGTAILLPRQAQFLNSRYNNVATELRLKVNFKIGAQIEVGDTVIVRDNGTLNIVNLTDGTRNSGENLYEVINRSLDLKTGVADLTLLSTVGIELSDRYATISPSSLVGTGSSTTRIIIQDSFGAFFPGNEGAKWTSAIGLPIVVHSADFSIRSSNVTFTGLDPTNNHALLVTPALGFTPTAGMIVEIADYDTGTDPTVDRFYKLVYTHVTPSVPVVSGVDETHFFVSPSDSLKFNVGLPVLLHTVSYALISIESNVTFINTGTGEITVATSLGFTPDNTMTVELIGFADGGSSYRIV